MQTAGQTNVYTIWPKNKQLIYLQRRSCQRKKKKNLIYKSIKINAIMNANEAITY